ncbi:MAG: CRISPR-associated helicase Cas3' [Pirellulales bacterium]
MSRYFAHSLPGRPIEEWEPLEDHLQAVSDLAGKFAEKFGAAEWGRVAGLWHDVGKYRPEFQQRLTDSSIHAPHAGIGAALAYKQNAQVGQFVAFAIAGHHTGLANLIDSSIRPTPLKEVLRDNLPLLDAIIPIVAGQICAVPISSFPSWLERAVKDIDVPAGMRRLAFFTRMLFSALVDADRLKTAIFYARAEGRDADHERLQYESLITLRDRLDAHIDDKVAGSDPTPVNRLRWDVLAACRVAASKSPGVFALTVPTGGGKTLSGMSFALRHATQWELDRVIVVIPFTSIIEQNSKRYTEALSPDGAAPDDHNVLEHHSAIDQQKRQEENTEQELLRQTAAENWDAPIIVTTTVQFFESLFSNHPSRCRKLHRIARSVVILDEVQTVPPALLLPILEALRELATDYKCSVVLSTATPPALEKRASLPQGLTQIQPIIPEPERLFASPAARRVEVEWRIDEVTPYEQLAAEMTSESQVLAIVHRRQDARDLCQLLPEGSRFHLSALMCPAHRLERIRVIGQELGSGGTCHVVSTQLIEAGVDVDFPVVYRALAGLDSLAQSAGRCDREGLRTQGAGKPAGRFIVFRAPTDPPGETLKKAMQTTHMLFKLQYSDPGLAGGLDLLNPRHALLFFEYFYATNQLDEKHILTALSGLNFATAAEQFQMIADQGMCPIVVPWGEGRERADGYRDNPCRETARALQPYLVQVNRRYFEAVAARGLIEVSDDSIGLPTSLFAADWYSDEFGLQPDPDACLPPDVTIV